MTLGTNMTPMAHEGERVRELLGKINRKPADLARACGVSRPAVDRYLDAPKIERRAWATLRPGLVKMGIDPKKVKPDDEATEQPVEDLRPLVANLSREELERIRKILEANEGAREKLLYYVDGALLPKR